MIFTIQTKDFVLKVEAADREQAIRDFFKTLIEEKRFDEVGQIATVLGKTENEDVSFRIVPALYHLGIIDRETAMLNIEMTVGAKFSDVEFDRMVETDKRYVEGLGGSPSSWLSDVMN
ncbi:MAG TPA: hypothetical protein VJP79_02195 [Nitrososphaera sp.]|nr:hypothetical protein [Nitrososphaera sp.]